MSLIQFQVKSYPSSIGSVSYNQHRILSRVSFLNVQPQSTKSYWALVDSGAFLNVIPYGIWNKMKYVPVGQDRIQGIHPDLECSVPALVAWVGMVLHDDKQRTPPLTTLAYLTPEEFSGIPLLIGMAGFLEKGQLQINLPEQSAGYYYSKATWGKKSSP